MKTYHVLDSVFVFLSILSYFLSQEKLKKNILNDEIDQFFQIAKSQMAFLHNYFIIQDFFFSKWLSFSNERKSERIKRK